MSSGKIPPAGLTNKINSIYPQMKGPDEFMRAKLIHYRALPQARRAAFWWGLLSWLDIKHLPGFLTAPEQLHLYRSLTRMDQKCILFKNLPLPAQHKLALALTRGEQKALVGSLGKKAMLCLLSKEKLRQVFLKDEQPTEIFCSLPQEVRHSLFFSLEGPDRMTLTSALAQEARIGYLGEALAPEEIRELEHQYREYLSERAGKK